MPVSYKTFPAFRLAPVAALLATLLVTATALELAGCAAGPDYKRPDVPVPQHYVEQPAAAAASSASAASVPTAGAPSDLSADWWTLFHSPALDALVHDALVNNPSVTAAQAALRAAVENRRAQQAAYFPTVGLGYTGTRQKIANPIASPLASNADLFNLSTAEVTVTYTPDLFGANRRQVESLQGQVDDQRWSAEATYLTLSSNLVVAAITEAGLRAQIDATQQLVSLQDDTLQRFRKLQSLGENSALDVAQQESQLAALQATLPPLQKQLAVQRDLIKALGGGLPDGTGTPEFHLDEFTLPEPLPVTLPSTLVEHRPDILEAEAQLKSASADIGVAAAARLPQVTLGVNEWGSSASSIAGLFGPGSMFWTLAGSVTQTVFDGGALKHREAAARATYDQAAAEYRSTVINAYQNVADALQAIDADAAALTSARHAQDAAERTFSITRGQLSLGDASPMAMLVAEQAVQQAVVNTAQARAARLADAAALFQALGGGWWNRPAGAASP